MTIEMNTTYGVRGSFGSLVRYGFIERTTTIVKFFQADYYNKGTPWTYVATTTRIDLKRPGSDDISFGPETGGMQTATPDTVAKYMKMVEGVA